VEQVFTVDADFNQGELVNVIAQGDQVTLNNQVTPSKFLWVAASGRGTIIKIDTQSLTVKGEYRTAPAGRGTNPSRTTVDSNGNVWTGNRDEYADVALGGSVVKVGLAVSITCG
jgi:streptogramin lyase